MPKNITYEGGNHLLGPPPIAPLKIYFYFFPQKGASSGITGGTGALSWKNITYFTFYPKRAPVPPVMPELAPFWGKSKKWLYFFPQEGASLGITGANGTLLGKNKT